MKKKLLGIGLVLALLLTVLLATAQAGDGNLTTLDISKGHIVIGADSVSGFDAAGAAVTEVDTDGYRIIGSNTLHEFGYACTLTVNGLPAGAKVVLDGATLAGDIPLQITGAAVIPLEIEGMVTIKGMSCQSATIDLTTGSSLAIQTDSATAALQVSDKLTLSGSGIFTVRNESGAALGGSGDLDASACTGSLSFIGNGTGSDFVLSANAVSLAGNTVTVSGANRPLFGGSTLTIVSQQGLELTGTASDRPLLNGTVSLTSVKGRVSAQNNGSNMLCSGALTGVAALGIDLSGNATSPLLQGATDLSAGGDVSISNTGSGLLCNAALTVAADGNVSINGASASPLLLEATEIEAGGTVNITNTGSSFLTNRSLTVTADGNITLTATSGAPLMCGTADLTATNGAVTLTNNGTGSVSVAALTVSAANDVIIGNVCPGGGGNVLLQSGSAGASITSGNGSVTLTNGGSSAVCQGQLTVTAKGPVQLSGQSTMPLLCSGAVNLTSQTAAVTVTNSGSNTLTDSAATLTVSAGTDVTLTNASSSYALGAMSILTAGAKVSCTNSGGLCDAALTATAGTDIALTSAGAAAGPLVTGDLTLDANQDILVQSPSSGLVQGALQTNAERDFSFSGNILTAPVCQGAAVIETGRDALLTWAAMSLNAAALTIDAGRDITLTGNTSGNPLFGGAAELNAQGKVNIANSGTQLLASSLDVQAAGDIVISGNTDTPPLFSGEVTLASSGGGVQVSNNGASMINDHLLTVTAENDITISGSSDSPPLLAAAAKLTSASGGVTVRNSGSAALAHDRLEVSAAGDILLEALNCTQTLLPSPVFLDSPTGATVSGANSAEDNACLATNILLLNNTQLSRNGNRSGENSDDGVTLVGLELARATEPLSAPDGSWSWTPTLTDGQLTGGLLCLNSASLTQDTDWPDGLGLLLPDGAVTIQLSGKNTINVNASGDKATGLQSLHPWLLDLTFSGSGSLEINSNGYYLGQGLNANDMTLSQQAALTIHGSGDEWSGAGEGGRLSGDLTVGPAASLSASGSRAGIIAAQLLSGSLTNGILHETTGNRFTAQGQATVNQELAGVEIGPDASLLIAEGATLTIPNGVTLTVAAFSGSGGTPLYFDKQGALVNDGLLRLPAGTDSAAIAALGLTGSGLTAVPEGGDLLYFTNDGTPLHTLDGDLDLSAPDLPPGDLATDGYHWDAASQTLTLSNFYLTGNLIASAGVTHIITQDASFLGSVSDSSVEEVNVCFEGEALLTVTGTLSGSPGNQGTITVTPGAKVLAKDGVSCGASGGVDGLLVVNGSLTAGSSWGSAVFCGQVLIGAEGCLSVSGPSGLSLNGMDIGGLGGFSGKWSGALTIAKGGVFTADCQEQAITAITPVTNETPLAAEEVFVLPPYYLPGGHELLRLVQPYDMDGFYTYAYSIAAVGSGASFDDDGLANVDKKITLQDNAPSYTLTFEVNGGGAIDSLSREVDTVIDLSAYVPTRDNYEFGGWYQESGLTHAVTGVTLTDNTTVYAKWNPINHTLSFESNGGSAITALTRLQGTVIDLADYVPTKDNYQFGGWYQESGLTTALTSVTLTANATVYAKWNPINHSLSFAVNGGSPIASLTRLQGTVVDLSAYVPTRENYEFGGWYREEGLITPLTSVTLIGNATVYAKWNPVGSFTLSFDTNGGTAIASLTRAGGTVIDLAAYVPTKDNCRFGGWYQESSLTTALTSVTLTANTTVYAKWEPIGSFTLSFDTNGGAAIASVTRAGGTVIDLSAYVPNKAGYVFEGWYYEAELGTKLDSLTLSADTTVYAKWLPALPARPLPGGPSASALCTLTFVSNGGTPLASLTRAKGTVIELAGFVPSREGYLFGGWHADPALLLAVDSVTLNTDTTVYADWTLQPVSFPDVPANAYYRDAVAWAVGQGITTGLTAASFGPDGFCTRAQTVTFLWRSQGCPEPTAQVMPFVDVAADSYYYKAVLWATGKNITLGTSATTFSPEDIVTRGQTVTFLWRAAGKPSANSENPFSDVGFGAYYYSAVLWAVAQDITTGATPTTFAPDATCTRAHIVTFLYRWQGLN